MTSTLIVRDVTQAINGSIARVEAPGEHLRSRIAAVSELDREFLEECAQVLSTSETGEETDPEVLEALFLLGVSRPELLREVGLNHATIGRRFAARMEVEEEPEVSLAALEFLLSEDPDNRGVQRDHAALMRRMGLVGELVDRHLAAAHKLISEGENVEAIELLREVLMLDRSRKDVARAIRDLRFQDVERRQQRRLLGRKLVMSVVAAVSLGFLTVHELNVRDEYNGLKVNQGRSLDAIAIRLDSMEGFIDRNPLWTGSFGALNERSRLRVEQDRLQAKHEEQLELADVELRRSREEAVWARERGRVLARGEDYTSALAEFERAMELGGDRWLQRTQTERDIQSLREIIEEAR